MSGGFCEVVRAETADLDAFVERGQSYVAALQGIFDAVAASRSRVAGQMGAASVPTARVARPFGNVDPLAEQVAEGTLTNAFVAEISAALADLSGGGMGGMVPAISLDSALARAGLDGLGADRNLTADQELIEALAIRQDLQDIVDSGAGLPDHLQGHQIGLELEAYLEGLDGSDTAAVADAMLDYGLDLSMNRDRDGDDAPGLRTAATMLVTQGLLLHPGDPGDLVDELATTRIQTPDGRRVRAIAVLVDALDLEERNDDLAIVGLSAGPWQRANQPYVRQALLSELIAGSHGPDGTISDGGQQLVNDVLDHYPGVVELAADAWYDQDPTDRYHTTPDGRTRTLPTTPLRSVLAAALAAPNYGLDDDIYQGALAIEQLELHLTGDLHPDAATAIRYELEVLIGILTDGDPDQMMLIMGAMDSGMSAVDAVRLAHHAVDPELTNERVHRLRVVYDTTAWGDPVPVDEVDPSMMAPEVAETLAAELGALQGVQLARFSEGRPVPDIPLESHQIELVERYAEVAPWFHHRFAWGYPGGAEEAVDYLKVMSDDELERIFGDVPDGFAELLDEIGDPANQDIWDLMAGASGNDRFLGPDGTYRPAEGDHVVSGDANALLVQLSLLRELGPYQELLDENGNGTIHEDEVERWLEAARLDPSIPPALVDRVAIGATAGVGEDTFGWDEIAAIIGVVGLAAAVTATVVFSGGTAVPLWVQGGLVVLAVAEGVAAHQSGDRVGTVLAGAGAFADLAAAARLLQVHTAADHVRLVELAKRSQLPVLRNLARESETLSRAEFARRYRQVLSDMGYDEFLDVINTRTLDEQIEIVANIERIDQQFVRAGRTEPMVGHAAGRHGPHLSDEAMFDRAIGRGDPVSRWSSWNALDRAIAEANDAVLGEAAVLASRHEAYSPVSAAGWRQVDSGNLTLEQILNDPDYRRYLKKQVEFDGNLPGAGTRFDSDGVSIHDSSTYRVVLVLDESGRYQVLTAFPTEGPT